VSDQTPNSDVRFLTLSQAQLAITFINKLLAESLITPKNINAVYRTRKKQQFIIIICT